MASSALDTNVLLPTFIDNVAEVEPERLYCLIFKTPDLSNGPNAITFSKMANAVNRCAQWLVDNLGKGEGFPTLAYVGPTDLRYMIFTLAAMKTGYKALLISPMNSTAAQLKLLTDTDSNVLLVANNFVAFQPTITAILEQREMNIIKVKSLDHWISDEVVEKYPFEATLEENPQRPFAILHTSGSTGLPKPIVYTCAALAACALLATPEAVIPDSPLNVLQVWKGNCMYCAFVPFHVPGFLALTVFSPHWNMPIIMGPPNVVPSPEIISHIADLEICKCALVPPAYLQALSKDEVLVEALRTLNFLTWTGAPFSSVEVAEKLQSYVPILPIFGTTELGPIPLTAEDQEYHEWMGFGPLTGATFKHHADDLYEMVITRDPKLEKSQFIFQNYPHLTEWPTRDLFIKHPTKKDLWKPCGRADDVFVMSHAANVNPLRAEGMVTSHPMVNSALLAGESQVRVAWLIELRNPPNDESEMEQLRDEIWPVIQEANAALPAPGRALKDAIVFTVKDRPMLRAVKGSVQRALTLQEYKKELDAVFNKSGGLQPLECSQWTAASHL